MEKQARDLTRLVPIMSSQAFSLIGSAAAQFALIWWLTVTTGSATTLAVAGSAGFLPPALLGPFVGPWIDRLQRKAVIIFSDMAIGLVSLVLVVVLLIHDQPPVSLILVVLALRSIGGVFHSPAWNATLPLLVAPRDVDRLVGWNQFISSGTAMLGPVLGGLLMAYGSLTLALLLDLAGAVVASAIMLRVSIPRPAAPTAWQNPFVELRSSLRTLLGNRLMLNMSGPLLAGVLFFLPIGSLFPLITHEYFQKNAAHSSLVVVSFGAGLLLSSLWVGFKGNWQKRQWQVMGSIIAGGALLLISSLLKPEQYLLFIGLSFLLGMAGNLAVMGLYGFIEEAFSQATLGRIFALISSVLSIATPVGLFIAAPFAEHYGIERWFTIAGLSILGFCLLWTVLLRLTRHP